MPNIQWFAIVFFVLKESSSRMLVSLFPSDSTQFVDIETGTVSGMILRFFVSLNVLVFGILLFQRLDGNWYTRFHNRRFG